MPRKACLSEDEKVTKFGITLKTQLFKEIEARRGDIPRATFIARIIQNYLQSTSYEDQEFKVFKDR